VLDWNVGVTVLLIAALAAPIVVVPGTFFPYVVPRNILFRVAIELATALCLVRIFLRGRRLDLRGEYVLSALGAFLLAITMSAIFSPARAHSLFGDFERMGGVWSWLHLVLFVLLLRTVSERHFAWLLHAGLLICTGASVHAIVERVSGAGELTVAGNAGLFAGYALLGIGLALYLAIASGKYRVLYLAAGAIEVAALLFAENRSSVLGLLVGGIGGGLLLAAGAYGGKQRWRPLWLALGLAALIGTVIGAVRISGRSPWSNAVPGVLRRIAATDFGGLDALRAMQWEAALAGFRDRPVLGFGAENYQLVWSAHFDPRSEQVGAEIFDRAHNQYLEFLATTGIVGTLAFLGVWLAIGYSLHSAFAAGRLKVRELAVLGGANVAYATFLMFWFVDINAAILWLLMAALIARRSNPASILQPGQPRQSRGFAAGAVVLTAGALAFLLHRHAYLPVRASIALATLDSDQSGEERASVAVQTISRSSAAQTSHFGPVLSKFFHASIEDGKRGGLHPDGRTPVLDRAFQAAASAFEAELKRDPLNDRLHTSAAGLWMDGAQVYDSTAYLERAIELLERAVELSPRRGHQRRLLREASYDFLMSGDERRAP